ncbi:MAG TPA: prepilin-type N-terminal cleavage/methylation domain-containing protein [Thermoleophilaceae bacterium]|nr:prepilin-type N-terminal cleavage/methylation domain-containing protein [Thermoleophilaceae bacterium]
MARARIGSQSGFTLVEVMVAIVLLLVGVLGAVSLIDRANAQTSTTKAREGATALARSLLEISRGVPYAELTSERVLAELDARGAGFADGDAAAGHQIASRGFVYTVEPTVCSMDDPKDSLGPHDELGVTFCANSDVAAGGATTVDRNPDDYRRVVVRLSWRVGAGGPVQSLTQTGIVTNPVGGLGPNVLALTPISPATPTITGDDQHANYDVLTSAAAQDVAWSVNGRRMGSAEGAGTEWDFTWDLGPVDDPAVYDCTYVVQAEAFDDKARAGAPRALTVTVNRRRPFGPRDFAGGANGNGGGRGDVDLQWDANLECDVQRYEVYREVDGVPDDGPVCEVDRGERTECVDEAAPSTGELTYRVFAFDLDRDGNERRGDPSPHAVVVPDPVINDAPEAPAGLTACTGGQFDGPCLDIEGNPASDGTAVLSWPPVANPDTDGDAIRFYRVYRAGIGAAAPTYADRLDVLFPVFDEQGEPVDPLVFVDGTASGPHRYWVTAVDERFAESGPVGPVEWGAP